MFQYAFAIALKHHFPSEEVFIDTSHFSGYELHNGLELYRVFPSVSLKEASIDNIKKVSRFIPNYRFSRLARKILPNRGTEIVQPKEDSFTYNPSVFSIQGSCYYEGYWNSAKYFVSAKDDILREFKHGEPNLANKQLIQHISDTESIGIHVRRGDYVNNKWLAGICDYDYYKKACEYVLEDGKQHVFFVFSDDISWCRDNLNSLMDGHNVVYVDYNKGLDSCWDMFLMTYCKDLIIANSTFSWWGAFLNKSARYIIAPSPWINRKGNSSDIYCSNWIILSK